jgi:cytochrome P450
MSAYMPPENPIAAVTHANPYPYYAELVAQKPIYYDDGLGMWVASGVEAVKAVLCSEVCRVRPTTEPVPKALLGSPAAEIFQHLVRMNDGERHCPFKQAVSNALSSIDAAQVGTISRKYAQVLANKLDSDPNTLTEFGFHLPVYVTASLLGVPEDQLQQAADWIGDYVRCVVPNSTPEQLERGKFASANLLEMFQALLSDEKADSLLAVLAREAKRVGRDITDVIVANGIGFMSQAYEATAGLIGNTLVTLADHVDVREQVKANPIFLCPVVEEVVRYDAPVQNTRRFVAEDGVVAGQAMKAGDVVLVVLAAANRDASANPMPERFDPQRLSRWCFTFGLGVHACPGEALAVTIAQAGVEQLLAMGVQPECLERTYRASGNTRVPLLRIRD